jgi:hypothetical protein
MVAAVVCIVEFEWNVRSAHVGCILVLGGDEEDLRVNKVC